jgi:hypothetical protein
MGEREIARGICEHILSGIGVATAPTDLAPNDTAATGGPTPHRLRVLGPEHGKFFV